MRGPSKGFIDVELEVPFHDVDLFEIVWHGHYYKYAEIGRTALVRSRGLDLSRLAREGHRLVVIETQCRYAFPLRYGERFRVRSWLGDLEHRIWVGFEIFNLTRGRRSARGHAILATLDPAGGLRFDTSDDLVQRLR